MGTNRRDDAPFGTGDAGGTGGAAGADAPQPGAGRALPAQPGAAQAASAQSDAEHAGEVVAALADATRRSLLDSLAALGEATATRLAEQLPVSRQAIVKHLAVLDRAGLVTHHRAGREERYAVRPAGLDATARWMQRLAADWDARLTAIKQIAEAAQSPEGSATPPDD